MAYRQRQLPTCPPAEGLREIPLSLTLLSPAGPSVEQKTDITTETTDEDCLSVHRGAGLEMDRVSWLVTL